jgi:hypothetical protein
MATGQQEDVLAVLDALEALSGQLASIPNSLPVLRSDLEMTSDDEDSDESPRVFPKETLIACGLRDPSDDEANIDDSEEEETVEPPVSSKKKRKRRSSGSDSGKDSGKKKRGRPPGSLNKKGSKATTKGGGKPPRAPSNKSDSGETKPKASRDPYMTVEEDYCLSVAFVNTSENPIHGANQKGTTFWQYVTEKYNELAQKEMGEDFFPRNSQTLQNRWKRFIMPTVMAFNRFWKEARNPPKSGWNEEKYNDRAKELFKEATKKDYIYEKCGVVLAAMPKFNPGQEWPDNEDEGVSVAGSSGRGTPVNDIGNVQGHNITRPIGNKKAKLEKYKGEGTALMMKASIEVQKEQVGAMKDLNKATFDLSKTIREKSYQESDLNLALLNFKMGNREKSTYFSEQAGKRADRWREREEKEAREAKEQEEKELREALEKEKETENEKEDDEEDEDGVAAI